MRVAASLVVAIFTGGILVTAESVAESKVTPWVGTWSLDTSRSTYIPGPPHKEATIAVTDAGDGKITYITNITDGAGEVDHSQFTCGMDQTACPVTTNGSKETMSITKLNSRNLKLDWKFDGPPPFSVVMLVKLSKDGKTQVAKSTGLLPDGTALSVTEVWHKK